MENNKQKLPYLEVKFILRQWQCGDWEVYSLPGLISEGKVEDKAGFLELPISSQHLGKTYLPRTPKDWEWLGRGAIKSYVPALLWNQSPKEILSSLHERLEVTKVCEERFFPDQRLLKWHRGLLRGVYQRLQIQRVQYTMNDICFLIPSFVVEAGGLFSLCIILIFIFKVKALQNPLEP